MAYKKVEPKDWKYENVDDFIEGVFVAFQKDVGPNNSMLYSLETEDGLRNVWGSAILDSRMVLVKLGSQIRLTYKGLTKAKPGKNPAKIIDVEVDDPSYVDAPIEKVE